MPNATQYQKYLAPSLTAKGGAPPYKWSILGAEDTLPEGMSIDSSTGVISSSAVGGQGTYTFEVQVRDSTSAMATAGFSIEVAADSTLSGCSFFPSNSIFHQRVDSLPVDTSPAAPIYSAYQPEHLRVFFGTNVNDGGIPFIKVPYDQATVPITPQYWDQSDQNPPGSNRFNYPIPANAPVEGTTNTTGDHHVLVLQKAGGGENCKLWEVYASGTWDPTYAANVWSGSYWDLTSNDLRPLTWTSGDAAGLPIAPLLVNYDETVSPQGIRHPIRFTVNHMLSDYVWPARHSAGVGYCTSADKTTFYDTLISQATPPASCTMTGPAGEIYRLKAGIDTSSPSNPCYGHPQATAILTAMKRYGIILADNGLTGGLIGTSDSRWNDDDLACLTNFALSQFEPVNVSSLQANPNSGEVKSVPASPSIDDPTSSSITTSTAGIGATIESTGGSSITAAGVVYGTTDAYGEKKSTSITKGAFKVSVEGLDSNTLYHFKGYATNSKGKTGYTDGAYFTTLPEAPEVKAASNFGSASFTANWAAPPGTATLKNYQLDVATNSNFSSFVPGYKSRAVSGAKAAVTGITSGKTYYYRIRAVNAGGTSADSNTEKVVFESTVTDRAGLL
jgi:hypothetical protein